jgi:TonB-dependent receptor
MLLNFYNKNRSKIVCTFLLAFLLLFQSFAFAQTGTIKGQITDKTTKDALVGANVIVQGTNLGAAADIDGKFIIHNVSSGNKVLVVSYIGYKNLSVSVNVEENKINNINISLEAVAIEGKTVIVTAQAKGQLQAINQQLSSTNIVNVVSAEKMQELPDANIAESIGRLPGISVQRNAGEANAVIVRGLSPKYNEVTIEGIPMSSTYYADRGVDLSLISDDLVRGVEVFKTLRPDMDADALGGTVNLTLKTAATGLHYNAWGTGAYNNLRDSYRNYKFSGSVSNRYLDDKFGVLIQGNIEQKQLSSDQFNATYTTNVPLTVNTDKYITTTSAQLQENSTNRHRYGLSMILDYSSELVDIKLFNVFDQKRDSIINRNNNSFFNNYSFQDQLFINETRTQQETHSIQALFKFNGTELPVSVSYTKGIQNTPNSQEFDFQENTSLIIPYSVQIYGVPYSLINYMGVIDANDRTGTTLWQLYESNSNLRDESYDAKFDWKIPFKMSDDFSGKLSAGGKFHETNRTNVNSRIYYNVQWGGSQGRRDTLANNISYLHDVNMGLNTGGVPAYVFVDPSYTKSNILGYRIGPGFDIYKLGSLMNTLHDRFLALYYKDGVQSFNQNYIDIENNLAGYIMGEFNIGNNLIMVAGARYQKESTDISAYHVQLNGSNQNGLAGQAPTLVETKRTSPGWYPSLNIKYKASDNMQLVGAVYKSESLPSYNEISPLIEYDPGNKNMVTGNPLLRPSTAWNIDLGASVFNNDIGLFTFNVFYKDISNLIYGMQNYYPYAPYPIVGAPSDLDTRLPGKGYFDTVWAKTNSALKFTAAMPMNNPSDAFLRGIEVSWQTHLWYLPGVLSGLVLDVNASWMSSNQMYPSFKVAGPAIGSKDTLVYTQLEGPLQDQPKAIYNAILGWDYMGFSSRFSVRYQQSTVSSLDTRYGLQNNYTDNILLIDVSLRQQIVYNFSIFANATNINNHIDRTYFTHPTYTTTATNPVTYPAGQLPTGGQTYSWIIQAGISFSY